MCATKPYRQQPILSVFNASVLNSNHAFINSTDTSPCNVGSANYFI
uniref:Uncharacterized protein n=1 Tax=Rhizophora mucronata TaxID=61149 RepID=A0A2P2PJU5_RHIMU